MSNSLRPNPMDCSPPGSCVHVILQERMLEWVAMPSSRGSSWPRDGTRVSCLVSPPLSGRFFTTSATWKAQWSFLGVSMEFGHYMLFPFNETMGFKWFVLRQHQLRCVTTEGLCAEKWEHHVAGCGGPELWVIVTLRATALESQGASACASRIHC